MADRRNPARDRGPESRASLISILHRCQDQVARFTMHPRDYNVYDELMSDFLGQVIPYNQFRRQMGLLLQNPRYGHLRIFYDVLRRRVLGMEQEDDGLLILYPAVIFVLYYSFLSSALLGETLWDYINELGIERARILDYQWAREWSRLRNRRYYPGANPIRGPDRNLNPEDFFQCFVNWCQEQVAGMTMLPEDYRLYEWITFDFNMGRTSCDDIEDEMGVLLRDPRYEDLRVWWNVYHTDVNGGILMEHNPAFTYPLHLCVRIPSAAALSRHLLQRIDMSESSSAISFCDTISDAAPH